MPPPPNNALPPTLALTNTLMTRLKPAKIFKNAVEPGPTPSSGLRPTNVGPRQITGIDFDDRGDFIVTAAEDEQFRLYNCKSGKQVPFYADSSRSDHLSGF
ncbi:hypothetical protein C0995_008179 [Termitomyces sp. Mi166|nr:hypothetical protein C0995_008179 [Termitomyces sp. Mi166\